MRGNNDHVRLMARVARMHHEQGMRQTAIATELHLSTARVSRLLKRAVEEGIVRTIVTLPPGVHTDLEQELETRYGLAEAVIVDGPDDDTRVLPALGAAAAVYLESTLTGEVVGIASWSSSLLAVMDAMQPTNGYTLHQVVQMVGGHGNPAVQMESSRLIGQFAQLTGAEAVMVPAPGLLGSRQARDSLLADPPVAKVVARWDEITVALVGIGTLEPSALIRESGNAMAPDQLGRLRELGAVGDICLRYFDTEGRAITSELDDRILGIEPTKLLAIPRRVGVAGGMRKLAAIRAAVVGGWVNVLVTDANVARALLA